MCELRDVFVVGAVRTAIGSFLGSLKGFKASDLGGLVIKEAVRRAGVAGEVIDEVIMGNVVSGRLPLNRHPSKAVYHRQSAALLSTKSVDLV